MKSFEEFDIEENIDEAFVPKCDADGTFAEVQCSLSRDQCFCVDKETGVKIPGVAKPGDVLCQKGIFRFSFLHLFRLIGLFCVQYE